MKIGIIGADLSGNLGAEAMLLRLVEILKDKLGAISLIIETTSVLPPSKKNMEGIDITFSRFTPKKIFKPYDISFKECEYIIDIGGLAYATSPKDSLRNLIRHGYFIIRRKKLIFYTQDFGPAQNILTRMIGRFVLNRAHFIFPRSKKSFNRLVETFGVRNYKIYNESPDITINLKQSNLDKTSIPKDAIIISPSAILFNQIGQKYIEFIIDLISFFSDRPVFLLNHCYTKNDKISDQYVIDLIASKVKNISIISPDYDVKDLKAIFSNSLLVLTSRYHVLVGSVSVNTPSFCIGWNSKYEEFLKLYDRTTYELSVNDLNGAYSEITSVINDIDNERRHLDNINKINSSLVCLGENKLCSILKK